jgi:hypothetical protein
MMVFRPNAAATDVLVAATYAVARVSVCPQVVVNVRLCLRREGHARARSFSGTDVGSMSAGALRLISQTGRRVLCIYRDFGRGVAVGVVDNGVERLVCKLEEDLVRFGLLSTSAPAQRSAAGYSTPRVGGRETESGVDLYAAIIPPVMSMFPGTCIAGGRTD